MTNVTPTVPPGANNAVAANQGFNVGPDIVTEEFGWRSGDAILTGTAYVDSDNNGFYSPGEGLGSVTITAVGTHGQGTFATQTWSSGGYSLPLPPGTYTVTATGNLPAPRSTTLTIGQDNVAWDLIFAGSAVPSQTAVPHATSAPAASPPAAPVSAVPAATSGATATSTPTGPSALVSLPPTGFHHHAGYRRGYGGFHPAAHGAVLGHVHHLSVAASFATPRPGAPHVHGI
jgi:hypothetical protein